MSKTTRKIPFTKLGSKTVAELSKLGCRPWSVSRKGTLMLFPGEWYNQIPKGYLVTDISYKSEIFIPGKTDDDVRFGMLPYGLLVPKKVAK